MSGGCLRIGTRRSALAMWQAEHVKARLEACFPGVDVELVKVVTTGDRIQDRPLASIGGKALFVKEIEERLISGEIDLAVHSMKDVPGRLPDGLAIVAVTEREEPRDVLVAPQPGDAASVAGLPEGARVATGSTRRACQLLAFRSDLVMVPIRGNVDTRLRKLDEDGSFDALVLAAAALQRLGLSSRISELIDPAICLPAVGQGALAIETRVDDEETVDMVRVLHDEEAGVCIGAERAFLSMLDGGCKVPLAAHAVPAGDGIMLRGLVGEPDGSRIIAGERRGSTEEAFLLGEDLAREILRRGGDEILDRCRSGDGLDVGR